MMRTKLITAAACMCLAAVCSFGQTNSSGDDKIVLGREIMPKDSTRTPRFRNHLIAPKGEWQCGLSVMYADFSSSDADYMLMLQGLGANASMLRLAPEAAYTFKDNHAVGARFQYTNVNGVIDAATADLLGNFSMAVENINASSRSMSAAVFQRTYVGLDKYGRVGLFWDYVLGVSRTRTQFYMGEQSNSYSLNEKVSLGFAPGIVYFPMNNVSVQASIGLANVSYGNVKAYEGGDVVGSRKNFKAQASLNILNLNFGLTIHL
jgi:long-subunit fatty acid transport protein